MKSIIGWAMLAGLLFTTAIAIIALVVLTIMNIAEWLKMRKLEKKANVNFANYAGNFTKERRRNVKARSIAKIITIFWPGNAQH